MPKFGETLNQFSKMLQNLDAILGKAEEHAQAKKFDVNNFLTMRLAPDMFTFTRQIQIACDVTKAAAAAMAGVDAPKHEDNEKTMAELRERITKVQSFLKTIDPIKLSDADPNRKVAIPFPPGSFMKLGESVCERSTPNLYFHIAMAYAILRQGGVNIGKGDFLGHLNFV